MCHSTLPAQGVLLVTLSKEKKLNAFDEPSWQDLRRVFNLASQDPNVNVVILCGKGRAFTSGLDSKLKEGWLVVRNAQIGLVKSRHFQHQKWKMSDERHFIG